MGFFRRENPQRIMKKTTTSKKEEQSLKKHIRNWKWPLDVILEERRDSAIPNVIPMAYGGVGYKVVDIDRENKFELFLR